MDVVEAAHVLESGVASFFFAAPPFSEAFHDGVVAEWVEQ